MKIIPKKNVQELLSTCFSVVLLNFGQSHFFLKIKQPVEHMDTLAKIIMKKNRLALFEWDIGMNQL